MTAATVTEAVQSVARNQLVLSLEGARRIVTAAQQKAAENGWHISVAVVDPAGQLIALERGDGALSISPELATGKARTAALMQAPSEEFEQFIDGGRPSFLATPGVIPQEGGLPVWLNGSVIGGVGVSGAHGENDSLIAETAVLALGV